MGLGGCFIFLAGICYLSVLDFSIVILDGEISK
jgi:hypothetical protein